MLHLSTLSQELLEQSRRACYPVNGCSPLIKTAPCGRSPSAASREILQNPI